MTRQMLLRLHTDDLVVDSFAGGGGASLGIEWALGRSPDIAINHDPEAIAMHAENHPATKHYQASVWDVDPAEAVGGRRVALAWFSPDCTHHSRARGGKPVKKEIRGLADVVIRWARTVKPRVICLENVEEFKDWGPLRDDDTPCPLRRGLEFRRWWAELEAAGYRVECRSLRAHDYGTPTSRRRLFIIARADGGPIVWPEATHGEGLAPYRTAAECIEWPLPCPSIFDRRKPLAEKTLRRIARGLFRFVIDEPRPFIVGGSAPTLIQRSWGERPGQAPRCLDLHQPLGTVVAGGVKHALVAAFLAKHYGERSTGGWNGGSAIGAPIGTITARDHHSLVMAFLTKYYSSTTPGQDPREPLHTITALPRFGLVTVGAEDYAIADIGMRMLVPRELYRAQGFPDSYRIEIALGGRSLTKGAQVRLVGNSVPPPLVAAIVRANVGAEQRLEAVG